MSTIEQLDVDAFRTALARSFSGEVRFDRLSKALYSTDASVYQIVPLGVVLPRSREDILHTVRTCAHFRVPLTARGGGTSQAGQAIGPGIILDCSKYYNRVLEINESERWVRVQPGCVLADLNERLAPLGLHFAPDISTANRATLGGMIANNSSGTRSLIYGKTIDHVLELTVLLADGSVFQLGPLREEDLEARARQADREGECYRVVRRLAAEHAQEIDRRYPKILRRVGGYNLDRVWPAPGIFNLVNLLVGSEGTLGVVLEAKLNVVELPRAKGLLVVQFPDLLDALAATPIILEHGPSAVEVMDKTILDCTRLNPEAFRLRTFLAGDPGAILIIEFYGLPDAVRPRLSELEADLRQRGLGSHFLPTTESALQQRIWKLRTLALGLSMAEKGDARSISFVEDTAVDPRNLRDYIAEFLDLIARHETRAGIYAHASVGCLHVRPVIDLKTEKGVQQFQSLAEAVADLVLKYNGALSGEHGDGLVRSPFQEKMFGPVLYQAFREIKQTFDPLGLLNPGKIVDPPPLTANLRYGPRYLTPEVPTIFDFSVDGGLTRATELCAGVGECRKRRGGMMCPSYRATREEQHSTRGRANALRLALTGQCDLGGLTEPALREALDLCLECKACKSECPTNVDMARLKAEFLHQYQARHGVSWRSRLLGNIASFSRWGCRLAPLSNLLLRSRPVRWLNEILFGLDRRRLPPPFARRSFVQQWASEQGNDPAGATVRVLLFPDTFTNYYQPEIGLATVRLLRHFGCAVSLGGQELRCCGRPMISAGLLTQAVACAEENISRLYPWAEAGGTILACEPSCLLTLKDDYPALVRGDLRRRAEVLGSRCFTLEEVLGPLVDASSFTSPGPETIQVQGHCHQRALTGMGATLRLLQQIPGTDVIDLNAGCCGMAGAFGYEKEHYEVSRLVGEDQLFPRLRQASGQPVIASGFSCRMQIEHFTGIHALHLAEFLVGRLSPHTNPKRQRGKRL
jgi:FAD/FMN-containing dehydrogenase/Fe-S oxidoreductase